MSDGLFSPGDDRAGSVLSDEGYFDALVAVENAWLGVLVAHGVAPATAKAELVGLVGRADLDRLAAATEAGGTPLVPLLALLRQRVGNDEASRWLHRGLTSQDVVDTALVLGVRDGVDRVQEQLRSQVESLRSLAQRHRDTVMAGRTLTQYAVPITLGVKVSAWLTGLLDAAEDLEAARAGLAAQVGGAAGTLAATTQLVRTAGLDQPDVMAVRLGEALADSLDLPFRTPWHTTRRPFTRAADALVAACDAWGHIASDVSVLGRPEIAELAEAPAPGRGGSSTMPHKRNPVLAVLVRRAAITAPNLAATVHSAAGLSVDERSDGAWHAEWAPLRSLTRLAVVAGAQTTELVTGLEIYPERMREHVAAEQDSLLAEQASIHGSTTEPEDYLGASGWVVDVALRRADDYLAARR